MEFISGLSQGTQNPFCGDSTISRMHNWNRHSQQLADSRIASLICGVRAIMVEKVMWKPLDMLLPRKIVNQKQYRVPGGISEVSITRDLKDIGVVTPKTSLFDLSI